MFVSALQTTVVGWKPTGWSSKHVLWEEKNLYPQEFGKLQKTPASSNRTVAVSNSLLLLLAGSKWSVEDVGNACSRPIAVGFWLMLSGVTETTAQS